MYNIQFSDESACFVFPLDLHQLLLDSHNHRFLKKEKHFFKVILDLDQRVQFILCIDCRSDVFTIYALERYAVINKISPGLKLKYKQYEMVPLNYHGEKEGSMLDLMDSISTSF
jgi:hypothetical protein